MEFSIDPNSRQPICRQLSQQIREGVARGTLETDEKLPSVRELSRHLVINPNTVARVYSDLEREGVLKIFPGRGVFVAQLGSDLSRKVRQERLREAIDCLLTQAVHLGFTAEEVVALLSQQIKHFQWRSKDS